MKKYQDKLNVMIDKNLYPEGDEEDEMDHYSSVVYEIAAIMTSLAKLLLTDDKDEWLQNIISRCIEAMDKNEVNRVDMRKNEQTWQEETFKMFYVGQDLLSINGNNTIISSMKEQIDNIMELKKYLNRNFKGLSYKSLINSKVPIKVVDKKSEYVLKMISGINMINKLDDVELELSYMQLEKEKWEQNVGRDVSTSFSTISCKFKFNEDTAQLIIDTVSNTIILG